MEVVGVGPNPRRFLTLEALKRIERADLLVGSESMFRELDGLRVEVELDLSEKELVTWNGSVRDVLEEVAPRGPVVLARGDPMYMGVGRLATALFEDVEVVPGVSSLQALMARFGRGFHEVERHVNLHSRQEVKKVIDLVREGYTTAVLFGKVRPSELVDELKRSGVRVDVLAGERLWYGDERLVRDLDGLRELSPFTVAVLRRKS
ncbi:SAM-dependent methyltransferase [Methanopyrus sp.]